MHLQMGLLRGSCLLAGLAVIAQAQDTNPPPPNVLSVFREYLKPGKAGAPHEKAESAFVQASMRAKWPVHYLALSSITGKPRVLFLYGYDSFEAVEKDVKAQAQNAALSAANERAGQADGELLTEADSALMAYSDEYSLRSAVDLPHMRYFDIALYRVRPGHDDDWSTIVKMVKAAYEKIPGVSWAAYHIQYGMEGNNYVIFTPLKSASEIDQGFARDKQFAANMGEDGMKKFSELVAASIETTQINLFAFSPKMSYVPAEWIKADPDFWKPKASSSMAPKKPAEKPAESH